MANNNDDPVWEEGVYRLEINDPVQGGADTNPSNRPHRQLGRRTAWLKQKVDALLEAIGLKAPLLSPAFTGSPTTPDLAIGDRSGRIPNSKWGHAVTGGNIHREVTGGTVVLTDDEAGYFTLVFTGTLTSDCTVVVPARVDTWVVYNATAGDFALRIKQGSGSGLRIERGRGRVVWCNGANVLAGSDDLRDAAMTGTPTTPTAPRGTATNQVANTFFVADAVNVEAAERLRVDNALNQYIGNVEAERARVDGDLYGLIGGRVAKNTGFTELGGSNHFHAAENGYCRLPNGLLIQWGVARAGDVPGTDSLTVGVGFTVAFSAVFSVVVTPAGVGQRSALVSTSFTTSAVFATFQEWEIGAVQDLYFRYIAIGTG